MTGGDAEQRVIRQEITPQLAEEMLKKNIGNRPPKPAAIKRYAGAIRRGEWLFNGEALKFSKTGRLVDGQNRLLAVIEADKSIDTMVVYGVDDDAQVTMDQGLARTLQDALKMRGELRVTILSGAIRVVAAFEQTGIPVPFHKLTVQEGLACFKRNPDLALSAKFTDPFMGLGWVSVPIICGLHYIMKAADPAEDAAVFFTRLRTGENLESTTSIYVLREMLIKARTKQDPIPSNMKVALTIKAWNAWREGRPVVALGFKPGGANPERFPRIHGVDSPAAPKLVVDV